MLKLIVLMAKAAIVFFTVLLFFSCQGSFKKVDGSGTVISQNRTVTETFKTITVSNGLEVIVEQGSPAAIIVEADDNLQAHILTKISGGKLEISTDADINGTKKILVRMLSIEKIETSAGSSVKAVKIIKAAAIELISESGSAIEIALDAEKINCEASSGSSLKLIGRTDKLTAEGASDGTVNALGLIAKKVTAEAASGSTLNVNPVESLSAEASSGATIKYKSTPNELDKKTDSGGSVSQY